MNTPLSRLLLVCLCCAGTLGCSLLRSSRGPPGLDTGDSTAREWGEKLIKARYQGKLFEVDVRLEEGKDEGMIYARGFTSGDWVDIEWDLGRPYGEEKTRTAIAIGLLRNPPAAGQTLEQQAASLGYTLRPEEKAGGQLFRWSWGESMGVPQYEDYRRTTDPHVILLSVAGQVTRVVWLSTPDVAVNKNYPEQTSIVPYWGSGKFTFYSGPELRVLEEENKVVQQEEEEKKKRAAAGIREPTVPVKAKDKDNSAKIAVLTQLNDALWACEDAIKAGDTEMLRKVWLQLTSAYSTESLAVLDADDRQRLDRAIRDLQNRAASLYEKLAVDSEKNGLKATSLWWLLTEAAVSDKGGYSPTPDLEKALANPGSAALDRATHLAAEVVIEVLPAIDTDHTARHINCCAFDGLEKMASLARARHLPVLNFSLGPWEGQLEMTVVKRAHTTQFKGPGMAANTEGKAQWERTLARLESELAELGPGDATAQALPDAVTVTEQEDIYGKDSAGRSYRIGTVAKTHETAQSQYERSRSRPSEKAVAESNATNRFRREQLRAEIATLRRNPPSEKAMGQVWGTWAYEDSCQIWKGELKRTITVGTEKTVQTVRNVDMPEKCRTAADPVHQLLAQDDWLSPEEARNQWVLWSYNDVPDIIEASLPKVISERIEKRLATLRSAGVPAAALERESKLLVDLFGKSSSEWRTGPETRALVKDL